MTETPFTNEDLLRFTGSVSDANQITRRLAQEVLTLREHVETLNGEPCNFDSVNLDYPAAARSIALNLARFCDRNALYPNMIAEAARRANKYINFLEEELLLCSKTTTIAGSSVFGFQPLSELRAWLDSEVSNLLQHHVIRIEVEYSFENGILDPDVLEYIKVIGIDSTSYEISQSLCDLILKILESGSFPNGGNGKFTFHVSGVIEHEYQKYRPVTMEKEIL